MFTVTTPALERLSQELTRRKAADNISLRFRRSKGRWRLRMDRARPDDAMFTHEGRNVLLLDKVTSSAMTAMTLYVRQTDAGPRLKLRKVALQKD